MLIPLAVFGATLLLILGGYWVLILRPEPQAELAVRRRLATAKTETAATPSLVKRSRPLSTIPALDKVLRGTSGTVGPLQQLVTQSGLHLTVGQLLLMTMLVFAVVALPIFFFFRNL